MISVIVTTYNPVWSKLKSTLLSILNQKKIHYEIIIADDGSKFDCREEIISLFGEHNFTEYLIVKAETNQGTCLNYYNGLLNAKFEYSKAISPGDLLYDENSLYNWYSYMHEHNAELSFGNAVYYEASSFNVIASIRNPQYLMPYLHSAPVNLKEVYLLLPDPVLGAALMVKTELAKQYVSRIINHVKYCEDYFIKFYILNGGTILYYNEYVLWYEYGLGVSTNQKWENYVKKDKIECAKLLSQESRNSWRWRLIWRYQIINGSLPKWRVLLFPSLISKLFWKKIKKYKRNYPKDNYDLDKLKQYIQQ